MTKIKIYHAFLFMLLVSIGLILYSAVTFQEDDVTIDSEDIQFFNEGWVLHKESGKEQLGLLPQHIKTTNINDVITLSNSIPKEWEGLTLAFRTSDQILEVYFDGIKKYEYGNSSKRAFGKTPGSAWNYVTIHADLDGNEKEIEIQLQFSSPYKNFAGKIPAIYVGTKSACVFKLLRDNIVGFLICFMILIFGFVLIISHLVIKRFHLKTNRLLYLGIFAVIVSVGSIIETRLLQLFWGNQTVLSIITFLFQMLGPVSMALHIGETYFIDLRNKYQWLARAFILNFFLTVLLQIFNIFDFMETNKYTHLLIAFSIIYIFIITIRLIIKKNREKSLIYFSLALFILMICVIIDVIRFYVFKADDVALFQRVGYFIYIFVLSLLDIKKIVILIRQGMETETLKKIAYEDIVTKCKNRIYFEEQFAETECNINKNSIVGIAIFDINNLKKINDSKGHSEGDYALIHSAELIRNHFSKYGVICRIGGDEFACIMKDIESSQLEQTFLQFHSEMKLLKSNSENENKIAYGYGIAYGYAYYDSDVDKSLHETFVKADTNMYLRKREMKKEFRNEYKNEYIKELKKLNDVQELQRLQEVQVVQESQEIKEIQELQELMNLNMNIVKAMENVSS